MPITKYNTNLEYPKVSATDVMIACALLKTGALLITRQIRGYHAIGTILLKHPTMQTGEGGLLLCVYQKRGWEKGFEFKVCRSEWVNS